LASERQLSDDIVRPHRAHLRERLRQVEHRSDRGRRKLAELDDEIEFQLIEAERQAINDRYRRGQLKDEARRRVERELDLRDAHLAEYARRDERVRVRCSNVPHADDLAAQV
jgi:monovalent cation/hydrogen antiporter